MAATTSKIFLRERNESVTVELGEEYGPGMFDSVIDKWQHLLNTISAIVDIPAVLIMRLNEDTIEVFLKNEHKMNPYEVGEKVKLDFGLYCETVIGTQKPLLVPDATKNPIWNNNNPDVDIQMISYLGYPINYPDGKVFGTLCILDNKENHYNQNIINLLELFKNAIETDFQVLRSNHELKIKNDELIQANQTKSRFLSIISHDIRSPISSLKQLADLMISRLDAMDKSSLKKYMNRFSASSANVLETLEGLLNWSKQDMLALKPQRSRFNVVDTIKSIIESFEDNTELKDQVVFEDFYSESVIIDADKDMIKSAIRNIFSNAVKYTPRGGRIQVRVKREGDTIIIEVEDNGVGMSSRRLTNLFTFEKDSTMGTEGETTAGIGLMLAREFIVLNDASIHIESELDKGTKVVIRI